MRAGHTEAGCDLAGMAGLTAAAVICEIMNDDGSMARLPELEVFAQTHGLKIGTIADLIAFRSHNESLIERCGERELLTPYGSFRCITYRDRGRGLHLALTHGRWQASDEVLVRVHEPFTAIDLLDVSAGGHSWPLARALQALQRSPRGVAVLLNCTTDWSTLLVQCQAQASTPQRAGQSAMDLRTHGIGAQILRDLGVTRLRVLGSPRRMPSMAGHGLEVTGFVTHSD
jgi:3,4-dihydroxy 2-butanone 4-phosphate synthase/GTP cyclohydrolase II